MPFSDYSRPWNACRGRAGPGSESGFYAGEDALAWVTGEHSDWPVVHVAGRTVAALEPFHIADPDPFRVLGKGESVP